MRGVRAGVVLGAALLITAGCSDGGERTEAGTASTTTAPTTDPAPAPAAPPTSVAPTPTTAPADDDADGACVVTVVAGDFLAKIAGRLEGVTVEGIQAENGLTDEDVIHPGDELDVCVGNDVDDVVGASRLAPEPAAVRRQQEHLNELFAPYLIPELLVDGDSGPLTRQMLCAARMGLGLPVNAAHMTPGSDEEAALFAATSLSIPDGAAVWTDRWILIDKTCQVMFLGEGDDTLVDIYPTSTGEAGFETREARAVAAFRYDPALDTDGWHDSSRFPVEVDNPLNGNMYKPLYFNNGQAIHGANYVPPEPRSKGCARLFPWHQDQMLRWLGLQDVTEPTWQESRIDVTVTVQGRFRPLD